MQPGNITPIMAPGLPGACGFAMRPAAPGGQKDGKAPLADLALDSLDDAVLLSDTEGKVTWANRRYAELSGTGRQDIVGSSRCDTIEPLARRFRDPALFKDSLLRLYDHPAEEGRFAWEMTDHGVVSLSSRPVRDGEGRIVGRMETYRLLDERGLSACGVERETIDALPVAIFAVDGALDIVLANRKGRELISQALGFDPRELQSFAPLGHDHPLAKSAIEALGSGRPVRRDGLGLGGRTFSLAVAPMVAQGRAYGAAIALVDTTEAHAAAETSERLRRESEFYVDLMSHDIRNFNQVSMGYIEMLGMSESLTPDDRAFLDKAMSGVTGSNKLINDIKRVRAIRESGDKNIGPADLGKIIKDDIAHVKGGHEGTTVIVNEDIGPGRMVMANDFVHFVFQHIMENAIKYDRHPDKVIDVDVSESREDDRGWWTVRMADRGPGLPEERRKSIFERMAGGTTRGAGLGLSIVRLTLDRLGGRIWVEDRVPGDPSQGSVFVVQLRKAPDRCAELTTDSTEDTD